MKNTKSEVITFKVDAALSEALKDIPNRSRFIRSAVLAALENVCPLCQGAGFLTPGQKRHWDSFSEDHTIMRCHDCHEIYLTCSHERTKPSER